MVGHYLAAGFRLLIGLWVFLDTCANMDGPISVGESEVARDLGHSCGIRWRAVIVL